MRGIDQCQEHVVGDGVCQGVRGRRSKGSIKDEGLGEVGWESKSGVEAARDGRDAMDARRAPVNPGALAGAFSGRQCLCEACGRSQRCEEHCVWVAVRMTGSVLGPGMKRARTPA